MTQPRIGGTFAPPIDEKKLVAYEKLASTAPLQVAEAMENLIEMMKHFRKTPASKAKGTQHPSGKKGAFIVPLEETEKQRMFDHIPWKEELDMYDQIFDSLPTGTKEGKITTLKDTAGVDYKKAELVVEDKDAKALRDACFHLLWFARELDLDREPITNDQLK